MGRDKLQPERPTGSGREAPQDSLSGSQTLPALQFPPPEKWAAQPRPLPRLTSPSRCRGTSTPDPHCPTQYIEMFFFFLVTGVFPKWDTGVDTQPASSRTLSAGCGNLKGGPAASSSVFSASQRGHEFLLGRLSQEVCWEEKLKPRKAFPTIPSSEFWWRAECRETVFFLHIVSCSDVCLFQNVSNFSGASLSVSPVLSPHCMKSIHLHGRVNGVCTFL